MPVYYGPGVRDWPAGAPPGTCWISTAPASTGLAPPLALDVLVSALALRPDPLVEELADVVAPSWQRRSGREAEREVRALPWDWVPVAEDDAEECFVAESLVEILGRARERIGVVARVWGPVDEASRSFLRRLARDARAGTIDLALDAPPALVRSDRTLAEIVEHGEPVGARAQESIPADCGATRLAALSPAGLPLAVVEQLAESSNAAVPPFPGPGGEPWLALPPAARKGLLGRMTAGERRETHARVFDALPSDGLGYLRRPLHALGSGDPGRIAQHHVSFVLATAAISRDVQFRYLALAAAVLRQAPGWEGAVLHCDHGAARLAPRVATHAGYKRATNHFFRALEAAPDARVRTSLWRHLGNVHAVQRRPEALELARRYFTNGFRELPGVGDAEEQLRLRIELLNGLALVHYHGGQKRAALALELRAQRLAREHGEQFPYVSHWATMLLSMNTAKLLERRFNGSARGIAILEQSLLRAEAHESEPVAVELGRLLFEAGDYSKIIEVLGPLVASPWEGIDETDELMAHLYVFLAAAATGDDERARGLVDRITDLCARRELPAGETLVAAATSLLDEPRPVAASSAPA